MALREFADAGGRRWRVWETRPGSLKEVAIAQAIEGWQRSSPQAWLTFNSGKERRRLTPSPQGWEAADEIQLRIWLAAAERVERSWGL